MINKDNFQEQTSEKETVETYVYGVSSELLEQIILSIQEEDAEKLNALLDPLLPADTADLLQRLDQENRRKLLMMIQRDFPSEVLAELEEDVLKDVLKSLGTGQVVKAISGMETSDAVYLIEDLPREEKTAILNAMSVENRAVLEEVLAYPEDSAGRLMQREVVSVPLFWTVKDTLDYIHETEGLPTYFYNVYVVDSKHCPIGIVGLSELLRQPLTRKIAEFMRHDLHAINVTTDQEMAAKMFRHYGLVSAPVTDDTGQLMGMITVDDIVDVIEQEAEEDLMHMAGVSESDFYASIWVTSYRRIVWLVVTAINVMMSVMVISRFETSLNSLTLLAFFMPVAASMGGNAGLQVVTVIIRALTTTELREDNTRQAIIKEVSVSVINGLFFALLFGTIIFLWKWDLQIGIVVAGALVCNMAWAGFAGAALPIFLNRLGMDPAISAGPLVTTVTDVLGYAIYLGLATIFLL